MGKRGLVTGCLFIYCMNNMFFVLDLHTLWFLSVHHIFHFQEDRSHREDDWMDVSV